MLKKSIMKKSMLLVIIALVSFYAGMMIQAESNHQFSEVSFKNQYEIGETLILPKVTLDVDGVNHDTNSVIYLPNGKAFKTSALTLDQFGQYEVEYRQIVKGKLYKTTHTFYVVEALYSFLNDKSTGVYDKDLSQYNTGHHGINVSLQRGDVFTYNDIIDLSQLDADTPAVELFVTPVNGIGTKDIKKLVLTFTDIYDETNSIKVIGNGVDDDGDPGQWWSSSVYLQAGAFDTTSGIEWSRGTVHTNNTWGYPALFSLYGSQSKRPVVGKEFFSIAFDLEEKQVFGPAGRKGNFIIDLDDSKYVNKLWDGFTTGEVYMTITAEEYTSPTFDFVITKIGLNDITPLYNYDQQGPNINVDFNGLNDKNLPNAKVGYSYPVFNSTAFDAVTKDSSVDVRVFYNYFASQRFELPIIDQRFDVNREGVYTIEYKSFDNFGNVTVKLVHLETTTRNAPLLLELDDSLLPSSSVVGAKIDMPNITYEGGLGKLTLNMYAKLNDQVIPITNNYFRPEVSGNYELIIELTDTIGQKETHSHTLLVEDNSLPVFVEDALLPRYLIEGSVYELDKLRGFDFNSNSYVTTQIFVSDGNGVNQLVTDYNHSFKADSNGQAIITYKASNGSGNTEISYKIDVVKVKDPHINMTKYFVGENLSVQASPIHLTIGNKNSNSNASFDFIHYLNTNQFAMKFRIDPLQNKFGRLDLFLVDYANNNQKIKVSFIKAFDNKSILIEINNQPYEFNVTTTFGNGGEISVVYDNLRQAISINNSPFKKVQTNLDQTKFVGFNSNKLYLSGDILQTSGKSAILISNINGQLLSTDKDDFVKPSVTLNGVYQSTYLFNQIATIYSASALDVLDPEVTGYVTVKDQGGKVVSSVDNILLDKVPFNRNYEIKLSAHGSYLVTYTARDNNGSGNAAYTYALFIADNTKPVITVSKTNVTKAKLNQSFKIELATAKDEVDGDLKVVYFMVLPTGEIKHIKDNDLKFTPSVKGIHHIRYFSVDNSGNQVYVDYAVAVE